MSESEDSIVTIVWSAKYLVGTKTWVFCFDLAQLNFQIIQRNRSVYNVDIFLHHDFLFYLQLLKVSIVSLPCEIVVAVSPNKVHDFIHVFTSLSPLCLSEIITILMFFIIAWLKMVLPHFNNNFPFLYLQVA